MGPLSGVRVIELGGIGPAPLAAMLLGDLGATVLRVERKGSSERLAARPAKFDLTSRNKQSIRLDLKDSGARALILDLVERADVLIEGFRPGVTERLGMGPSECLERNPRLTYGRVTGWGQTGPHARAAGHDINYIAVTGMLNAIGRAGQPPSIPLNVLGDYAGGALYLAFGVLASLLESKASGKGQIVDTAIVDGVASLMSLYIGMYQAGQQRLERGVNLLDSGAPFYDVYECADRKFIAVGPLEGKFFAEFVRTLAIPELESVDHRDPRHWPYMRARFAACIKARSRSDWVSEFDGSDACVAPVLSLKEAYEHPQLRVRGTFIEVDGVQQAAPAPRFSRTSPAAPSPPSDYSIAGAISALQDWLPQDVVDQLVAAGTVA